MSRTQFYTTCKYCGKQILMTPNKDTWKYTPCNPEVIRFFPDPNAEEWFIDEDRYSVCGFNGEIMGEIGYRKHSCKTRASA